MGTWFTSMDPDLEKKKEKEKEEKKEEKEREREGGEVTEFLVHETNFAFALTFAN